MNPVMLVADWLYRVVDGRRLCGGCLAKTELRPSGSPTTGECDRCGRYCT